MQIVSVIRVIRATGLAFLFLVLAPAQLYLHQAIPHTPTSPQQSLGYIFPYNNNGVTHYLTSFQTHLFSVTWPASFICVLVVAATMFLDKVITRAKSGAKDIGSE